MKVYIVRHGESEANKARCFCGWGQVSLTEKGFKDAESVRAFMQKIKFDKVYSSDLIRAVQTAETALPGAEIEKSPLIREVNVGSLMGKPVFKTLEEMGEPLAAARRVSDYRNYGGESMDIDVRARVGEFLRALEDKPYENVAVFAHEGVLKIFAAEIIGCTFPAKKLKCPNCCILVIEYFLDEDGTKKWAVSGWFSPDMLS